MPREIELTQGQVTIVDDEDYAWLVRWTWHAHKRHNNNGWYAARNTLAHECKRQRTIRMHRAIMGARPNQQIDHKDGDSLNNQRSNLRVCSGSQNMANAKKTKGSSSKYKGVTWRKRNKKWRARIYRDGVQYHIGYFTSELQAALAYDEAARQYYGEFACTNFATGNERPALGPMYKMRGKKCQL